MAKSTSFFARLRQRLRVVTDPFPLTGAGLVIAGGATWALLKYGLQRIDLILLVVAAVALGVAALSVLLTIAVALVVRLGQRNSASDESVSLECGYPARTGFSFPRLWWVPFVSVSWEWLEPEAVVRAVKKNGRLHEEVIASRRGVVKEVVRRFEVADIFGLAHIAFKTREKRTVRFVPSVGNLKHIEVIRGMSGGDDISHPEGPAEGDPYDMRHYNPGDPIRFVLWKVFAKSRDLVIRTPERAISPARQTVAYMVASKADEPAAGAARVAVDGGALGREWVLGADGSTTKAKTKDQALDLLVGSAKADEKKGGAGLAEFLTNVSVGSVGRAVVFVPGRPGPWLDKVADATRNQGGRVEFVICTDGVERPKKPGFLRRVALGDKGEPTAPAPGTTRPATAAEINEVVKRLTGARSKVVVIDRVAGKVYSAAHLEHMDSKGGMAA